MGREREKGRERHLYFVCGQKYNSQTVGLRRFPQTRQGQTLLPIS